MNENRPNYHLPKLMTYADLFIFNHLKAGAQLHALAKGNYKLFVPSENKCYYPSKICVKKLLDRGYLTQIGIEIFLVLKEEEE